MFYKLRRKIFNSIFWVVFTFVFVTSVISYATIISYMFSSQGSRTQQNAQSGADSINGYLETVMGFADNASQKKVVIDALHGGSSVAATALLDDMCNTTVTIDGAILYGINGYVSYSAGVGTAPSFADLQTLPEIKEFLNSDAEHLYSVRKQQISQVYNRTFYNTANGIVSCISKVYDSDGVLIGIIEADILPQTLSDKIRYSSFGAECSPFLVCSEGVLSDNEKFVGVQIPQNGTTRNLKYYTSTVQFWDGAQIAMIVPLKNFITRSLIVLLVFVAMDVVLVCMGTIVAYVVRDKVVVPLENLHQRMLTEGQS